MKHSKIKISLSHYPDEPCRKTYFITTQNLIQELLYVLQYQTTCFPSTSNTLVNSAYWMTSQSLVSTHCQYTINLCTVKVHCSTHFLNRYTSPFPTPHSLYCASVLQYLWQIKCKIKASACYVDWYWNTLHWQTLPIFIFMLKEPWKWF